jgi:hypothetical protein
MLEAMGPSTAAVTTNARHPALKRPMSTGESPAPTRSN